MKCSERRLEAQLLVHVVEANGRIMSGAGQDAAMATDNLSLNSTASLELHDQEINSALFGESYRFYFPVLSP